MKQTVIIFIILVIALSGLTAYFFLKGPGGQAVSLEFGKIEEVTGGKPFNVDVTFSNNKEGVLKNARLSLTLPDNVSFVGESEGQRVKEKFLGDVGPGSLSKESFNLIATQGGDETRTLKAKLVYSVAPDATVSYEIQSESDISVSRPSVSLTIEAPDKVSSGQDFQFKVKYTNDSGEDVKNLSLKIDYPPIFQFVKSSVDPDQGNNVWKVPSLLKGEEREVDVNGSVIGPQNSSFDIRASLNTDLSGENYLVSEQKVTVPISEAPLSLSVLVNQASDYVAHLGDKLTYSLVYKNNASISLQNVTIKAKLVGEMYDFGSIHSDGSFNFGDRTVYWTSDNVPALASLAPGSEGQVELEIKVKDSFLIKRISDKNYTLKLQAEISSPTKAESSQTFVSVANIETKLAGKIGVEARAYFRDAVSGILNSGNFPPQVNQLTQYTVHWIVRNFATDVASSEVSAVLPAGAQWTGRVKTSQNVSDPTFDSALNKVVWKIDKIMATRGVIGEPIETVFQIGVTPNSGQVGQTVDILGATVIKANDDFTGVTLNGGDDKVDTNLPDDSTVASSPKVVQP
ncbi:MAG: hypothetical protein AAB738_01535 [Patescibacteria group bacterium]